MGNLEHDRPSVEEVKLLNLPPHRFHVAHTIALSDLVLGLGLIFDVSSSSGSSSPAASTPAEYEDHADFFASPVEHQFDDVNAKITSKGVPKCVEEVVEVHSLSSPHAAEAILAAEGRRGTEQWLVIHVRDTTTALLFPPLASVSIGRCGLTRCMEWLEDCGITQLLVAVPSISLGEAICKSLLFLGFSRLPKDVATSQIPPWLEKYRLLVTDFTEV
ncbi:hypothetical protein Aperf_G00000038605 [Anoplocephala perfoliata]